MSRRGSVVTVYHRFGSAKSQRGLKRDADHFPVRGMYLGLGPHNQLVPIPKISNVNLV